MNKHDFIDALVNRPSHYTSGRFEVIDVLDDWVQHAPDPVAGAYQWQCLKYLSRMWLKDDPGVDASKSMWYLKRLIAYIESTRATTDTGKTDGQL
jgi:hypothetical protein